MGMPQIQISLTPAESKRLIAKAVAELPEVRRAFKKGTIIIGVGTTNACIVEELLGQKIEAERFVAGAILPEGTSVIPAEKRLKEIIIQKGKMIDARMDDVLADLTSNDVFIKGANALDATGTAGVFLASRLGGTVGKSLGVLMSRGVNLIIPIGLEKFIPGLVKDVALIAGIDKTKFSTGVPVGVMPLAGKTITELEAIRILSGAEAVVIGKGGISGAEGSVTLVVRGTDGQLRKVEKLVAVIKGKKSR